MSSLERAAGPTSSGLNGFASTPLEEFFLMSIGARDEPETRRMFTGWKARHGRAYRDAGEEECRYWLFQGNRRVVDRINAAAGRNAYGLNRFGDLTNEEILERCYYRPEAEDRELSARCQADPDHGLGRLIRYQVCRCIATELKQKESGGSAIHGDEAHMWIV
ncbi:oryzain alpha chain-like [Panicum virgatum]|uniref:Cathepsin propeptide inhibitor domain-containing protein n=1 Tax=Panicum virgatum TaxID=38727 RepID=A0A8T0UFP3_PANVG|nr:oryzain alpha chain-like [Panicum virgatum]KAG2619604.1 hypothetical protein PVAP13_3NG127400 [Panicum virgatum]